MRRRFVEMGAAGTAGAGFIHLAYVGPHAAEALWLGGAFLAAGLAQVVLAYAMLRQAPQTTLMLVCLVNSAIVLGWALSRTVGLPTGTGGWSRELPGLADVTATSLETLSVLLIVLALPNSAQSLVRRSVLAGALGIFLLSGSSALARTVDGKTPLIPARSHHERGIDPSACRDSASKGPSVAEGSQLPQQKRLALVNKTAQRTHDEPHSHQCPDHASE